MQAFWFCLLSYTWGGFPVGECSLHGRFESAVSRWGRRIRTWGLAWLVGGHGPLLRRQQDRWQCPPCRQHASPHSPSGCGRTEAGGRQTARSITRVLSLRELRFAAGGTKRRKWEFFSFLLNTLDFTLNVSCWAFLTFLGGTVVGSDHVLQYQKAPEPWDFTGLLRISCFWAVICDYHCNSALSP